MDSINEGNFSSFFDQQLSPFTCEKSISSKLFVSRLEKLEAHHLKEIESIQSEALQTKKNAQFLLESYFSSHDGDSGSNDFAEAWQIFEKGVEIGAVRNLDFYLSQLKKIKNAL